MYKYALFDLDGTLTDPGTGITNSVRYALDKFGIHAESASELYKFIGPPLQDSFREYYHFSPSQCEQAITYYREYFSQKGLVENTLYQGTIPLLQVLSEHGIHIVLATSKPEYYASQIIEHFQLTPYFDYICGANMDGTRTNKAEVIRYALAQTGLSDYSQAIMIGDRKHDIIGAREVGIDSIGVLFGYGSKEELANAGATYIVSTSDNILKILL